MKYLVLLPEQPVRRKFLKNYKYYPLLLINNSRITDRPNHSSLRDPIGPDIRIPYDFPRLFLLEAIHLPKEEETQIPLRSLGISGTSNWNEVTT